MVPNKVKCFKSTSRVRHSFVEFLFVVNSWHDLVVPLYMYKELAEMKVKMLRVCLVCVFMVTAGTSQSGDGGWSVPKSF